MPLTDLAILSTQAECNKINFDVYIIFMTSHLKEIGAFLNQTIIYLLYLEEKLSLWRWCVCVDLGHKFYFLEPENLFCSVGNDMGG